MATTTSLMQNKSFRWLIAGGALSILGDQFTIVALPWLVLKMTGDPAIVGTVLAIIGVPRAVLLLFGGALVDNTSSKFVLLMTKYANAVCLGVLAFLVYSDILSLGIIYGLAFAIGIISAFSFPAGTAILSQVVQAAELQAANGMLMSVRQISLLLGPLFAGILIAFFGDGNVALGHSRTGLSYAFLFDCLSFVISAWTLSKVILHNAPPKKPQTERIFTSIKTGLHTLWRDQSLRALCLYYAAVALLTGGPVQVALPLLADRNLPNGAADYGTMMAGFGAGALLGMIFSSLRPNWRLGSLGTTILILDALISLLFLPLGYIHAVWQGIPIFICVGAVGGYIQVVVFSWMQRRVAPEMIGRAMSVFMFIFFGLAPISAALTGWLLKFIALGPFFDGTGALLLIMVIITFLAGTVARIGRDTPAAIVPERLANAS